MINDAKLDTTQEVLLSTNLNYNKGEVHGLRISSNVIMLSNEGGEAK